LRVFGSWERGRERDSEEKRCEERREKKKLADEKVRI